MILMEILVAPGDQAEAEKAVPSLRDLVKAELGIQDVAVAVFPAAHLLELVVKVYGLPCREPRLLADLFWQIIGLFEVYNDLVDGGGPRWRRIGVIPVGAGTLVYPCWRNYERSD